MTKDASCTIPNRISAAVSDVDGTPLVAASQDLVRDLVLANHILYDQGVVDGFGHVSVRHDACPDRFLLARNMAPTSVTEADIIQFDLESEPLNANGRRVYLERFIHGEIYRAYPDVQAVVHSHSPSIVPLTAMRNLPLRPIFHMAGFIGSQAPVFDVREVAGDGTDLLVRNRELGASHANCFCGKNIVLIRGHGSTVVGTSLQHAVYRAIYAEQNARYQLTSEAIGEVTYLTEAEAEACARTSEGQIQRPWDLWKAQAAARRAPRASRSTSS